MRALALEQASGDLYVGYYILHGGMEEPENVIHKFNATDEEVCKFKLSAKRASAIVEIQGLALDPDPAGLVSVVEREGTGFGGDVTIGYSGSLLDVCTGKRITEFRMLPGVPVSEVPSLAFNAEGEMYGVSPGRKEVIGYVPREVAELVTGAVVCKEEGERETSVTVECELAGQVDPAGVADTETLFLWGKEEALNGPDTQETPKESVAGNTLVQAPPSVIKGLLPGEILYDKLAGYDEANPESEEALTGEELTTPVPMVPPRVVGEPSVSFVNFSSAVMSGELNPENANTRYEFQYAKTSACEELEQELQHSVVVGECSGKGETPALESSEYGRLHTSLEASGLQPATRYRYRLFAVNGGGDAVNENGVSPLPEDTFTTAPAPVPLAETSLPSAITATSAIASGKVNPDNQPAVYTFELGIYNGASTQYGIVLSASAGSGAIAIEKNLTLSGLRPSTTYAYRIVISSTYGTSYGAPVTFTTSGLLAALQQPSVLEQLPIPNIAFPRTPTHLAPKKLTTTQQLANALKACTKKPKTKRTACKRNARKRYTVSKKGNKSPATKL